MIFIDWISTPDHRNFNRAFFYSLGLESTELIVFSDKLVLPEVKCSFVDAPSDGRFWRAIRVLKIIWQRRNEQVFFLTYDPILLPIISFFKKGIIVFEHNTTPEWGFSKHLIWQKIFFGGVHRIAQFPVQHDRLQGMGSKTTYIGSPLMPVKIARNPESLSSLPNLYIAPSYRANISELEKYADFWAGSTVILKSTGLKSSKESQPPQKFTIRYLNRIEFCHDGRLVDAIIITVRSRVRGTGWFNDSISNRMPIIITNLESKELFEETFPAYPYVFLSSIDKPDELDKMLAKVRCFDSEEYVKSHNARIRARFQRMCIALGVQPEC